MCAGRYRSADVSANSMGMTKAERAKAEKAEREAAWEAEQARVKALGDLFSALPEGHQKAALLDAMTDRIIDLYNNVKHEQGDVLLEFLPNDYAQRFLDWYFDEDAPDVAPDFRRPARDERRYPASAAGQSERTQAEASPDAGTAQAPVESKAPADQSKSGTAGGCFAKV